MSFTSVVRRVGVALENVAAGSAAAAQTNALASSGPARLVRPQTATSSVVPISVVLGKRASVWHGAVLGERVTLKAKSSVGENSVIEDDVILGDNTTLGPGAKIGKGAVLGSGVVAGARVTIAPFARVPDGTYLPDGTSFPLPEGRELESPPHGLLPAPTALAQHHADLAEKASLNLTLQERELVLLKARDEKYHTTRVSSRSWASYANSNPDVVKHPNRRGVVFDKEEGGGV